MKFTDFENSKVYIRQKDGKFFKKEDDKYFLLNSMDVWKETNDLALADEFKLTKGDPGKPTFEMMVRKMKSGDIQAQNKYETMFFREAARLLDKLSEKV